MRRMRRKNERIRKIGGIILALGGSVILIQSVPLTFWYIILIVLVVVLLLLLFIK